MHPDPNMPTQIIKTPEKCTHCGKWYTSRANLSKHIRNQHPKIKMEHRCPTCGFVSTTASALKKHILYNHDSVRRYPCHMCDKAFKSTQHLKVSSSCWAIRLFLCLTVISLQEHVATHTGESLYACIDCGLAFKSKANMFHHRRRLHREEWLADRTKPPKEKYSRN